jgi:hypothetical protein
MFNAAGVAMVDYAASLLCLTPQQIKFVCFVADSIVICGSDVLLRLHLVLI